MVEMPETWGRVIGALVGGVFAWRTPGEVAGTLGWGEGVTTDVLASLDADGWLAVWEVEGGPLVTLSPLGADRLGVRLVEVGYDEVARWAPAGDPEPPRPRARHVCAGRRAADMDFVVDPQPGPDEALADAEWGIREAECRDGPAPGPGPDPDPDADADHAIRLRRTAFPFPSLLIGQGLCPWPGPGRDPAAPCPACRERPIRPHAYCLCCDRWGLDGLLAATRRDGPGRPAGPGSRARAAPPRHFPLANPDAPPGSASASMPGQAERDRRKARRRRKMQARIEAERGRRTRPDPDGSPLA